MTQDGESASLAQPQPQAAKPISAFSAFTRSIGVKFFLIGLLVVMLSVPLLMVWALVQDRESNYRRAVTSIGQQWGGEQVVRGPFIAVPAVETVFTRNNQQDLIPKRVGVTLYFTPDELRHDISVEPETRKRGIHEAVVYQGKVTSAASFSDIRSRGLPDRVSDLDWSRARLVTGLSDLKGIDSVVTKIGSRDLGAALPGDGRSTSRQQNLFHHPFDMSSVNGVISITQDLSFKGSQSLLAVPAGADTKVSRNSIWPHPSFTGAFLPKEREVSDAGFTAEWQVPQLARPIPPVFVASENNGVWSATGGYSFGVDFYQPVDFYRYVDRAVKYGILFVSIAFLVIFVLEILSGRRMHVAQYTMAGLMVILFYVLLLALAEQMGFGFAYAIAAGATGGVLSAFAASIFNGKMWTISAFGGFTALYGMLYIVLSLEEAALLVGAITGFVILTVLMFATRGIDWSGSVTKAETSSA